MVKVAVWGSLRDAVSGRDQVEVDAGDVGELLARLGEHYPGLRPQLARGVAVSIDGVVHNRSRIAPIAEDAEVVLLPRIEGG